MKNNIKILTLFAAAALLLTAVSCASAQEVFKNFDVSIRINEDSSLSVTETITAKVENVDINRGIIRSFPVEYRTEDGDYVEVGFDVAGVTLDGAEIPWSSVRRGRDVDVRIGDPDKMIPVGYHTFVISYKTTRQVGFFEDHDELYWNTVGTEFMFPILSTTCRVALPGKNFGEGFNTIEWYVGRMGEKGGQSRARLAAGGVVETTRALAAGEALTVVYTWPKGLVTPPPPPKRDNETAQGAVGAATLAAMAGWFWFAWNKWGKDPVRKAVIPIFSPPEGKSPAFMRYVRDMRLDKTGFTAAIMGLAVKGALKIEEEEGTKTFFGTHRGDYVLHETEVEIENLEPEEDALMMQLFPGEENELRLTNSEASRLSAAMKSLGRNLRKYNAGLFSTNDVKCLPGVAIYLLGTAALYPFSGDDMLNLILVGVCGLIMLSLGLRLKRKVAETTGRSITQFIGRLFPSAVIALVASTALIDAGYRPFTMILFAASAAVLAVMRPLMVARTRKGSDMLSSIEGLVMYMDTAEKERLEMFNPPDETPEVFEKLLPYAFALDAAKTWGSRFESVLEKARYEPTWYSGPSPYIFMNGTGLNDFAGRFGDSVNSSMTPKSAGVPGGSSGMGGGGFAGGGGGGGGARGW